MIRLADLLEIDVQPSERAKLKNFLYRGSRDQVDLHREEGMLDTSNHPEDHNNSNAFNKGYPWSFEDPSGIFEEEGQLERIHQALIGREFQTLEDLGKMCSRLRQAGHAQSDIEEFLRTYII